MKSNKYPITFRIPLPDTLPGDRQRKSDWYYEVRIFGTRPAMRRHREELGRTKTARWRGKKSYDAMVCTFTDPDPGKERQFGIILFSKATAQRVGIVAHELSHAATFWWEDTRKTRDIWKKYIEQFAILTERLTNSYWSGLKDNFPGPYHKGAVDAEM